MAARRVVQGIYGKVHERKKLRIMDHGEKNFVFFHHENKQVTYSYTKESV